MLSIVHWRPLMRSAHVRQPRAGDPPLTSMPRLPARRNDGVCTKLIKSILYCTFILNDSSYARSVQKHVNQVVCELRRYRNANYWAAEGHCYVQHAVCCVGVHSERRPERPDAARSAMIEHLTSLFGGNPLRQRVRVSHIVSRPGIAIHLRAKTPPFNLFESSLWQSGLLLAKPSGPLVWDEEIVERPLFRTTPL